ncbi:AraC-like DNA-binding protein [Pelomonas aquatica]|uniref:AraC-like DNA-binding protein n=1 Tax=Pelomonas aquatica TaxID=431058 RepID=A0ABU1ZFA7_9BURK|nr:helix-turn-helix domain-containing protein [Pelomonas aquatica]MDR7299319.1 AraC-like DNA-binding protein [Pelomonas aquatica]
MPSDIRRQTRPADSPSAARFIARIDQVDYAASTVDVARPDGTWDLVFRQGRDGLMVLQTGQTDHVVHLPIEAGDRYFCIAFRPEVYMPQRPGARMTNRGHVHALAGRRDCVIDGQRLELPTFDNAEHFVLALARHGLLEVDGLLRRAAESGWRNLDDRSLQRHSAHVTGLSPKKLQQIVRADVAARLLQQGVRPAEVAVELGYSDQAHLSHSLRRILGATPGQLRPADA